MRGKMRLNLSLATLMISTTSSPLPGTSASHQPSTVATPSIQLLESTLDMDDLESSPELVVRKLAKALDHAQPLPPAGPLGTPFYLLLVLW